MIGCENNKFGTMNNGKILWSGEDRWFKLLEEIDSIAWY